MGSEARLLESTVKLAEAAAPPRAPLTREPRDGFRSLPGEYQKMWDADSESASPMRS